MNNNAGTFIERHFDGIIQCYAGDKLYCLAINSGNTLNSVIIQELFSNPNVITNNLYSNSIQNASDFYTVAAPTNGQIVTYSTLYGNKFITSDITQANQNYIR